MFFSLKTGMSCLCHVFQERVNIISLFNFLIQVPTMTLLTKNQKCMIYQQVNTIHKQPLKQVKFFSNNNNYKYLLHKIFLFNNNRYRIALSKSNHFYNLTQFLLITKDKFKLKKKFKNVRKDLKNFILSLTFKSDLLIISR